ncbi:hypothetical protein V6N11_015753 [Hibiscus sabdariffa]|uniref:Uncharacterized protein n=1 Tax=Hibiscus sabdariffa TaxID=183260 RepID=A0ABR2TTK7_9ROSI
MPAQVQILYKGKPSWEVRTRNWKFREGESRRSGLLEGVSIVSGEGKKVRRITHSLLFKYGFVDYHRPKSETRGNSRDPKGVKALGFEYVYEETSPS